MRPYVVLPPPPQKSQSTADQPHPSTDLTSGLGIAGTELTGKASFLVLVFLCGFWFIFLTETQGGLHSI